MWFFCSNVKLNLPKVDSKAFYFCICLPNKLIHRLFLLLFMLSIKLHQWNNCQIDVTYSLAKKSKVILNNNIVDIPTNLLLKNRYRHNDLRFITHILKKNILDAVKSKIKSYNLKFKMWIITKQQIKWNESDIQLSRCNASQSKEWI